MKKSMKPRYKAILLGLAVLVAVSGGYFYNQKNKASAAEKTVTTVQFTATKGDLVISLESDGSATIDYQNIDPEVTGKLTKVYVKAGDQIKKGQLLAEVDSTEYEKAYKSAKIAYDKAKLTYQSKVETVNLEKKSSTQSLQEEKIKYEELQDDYNTMLELKDAYAQTEIDAVKVEMEAAKRTYENDKAKIGVTTSSNYTLSIEKMTVESAKVALEEAEEALDQCTIQSDFDGYVLKVSYNVGDVIEPNTDSGDLTASTKHFIVLTPSKNYQVLTSVSEQDLSLVSLGQEVEVVFDALGGETYAGKVVEIEQLPNTASNGVISYNVTAELNSGFEEIRIGMTAQIQMILKKQEDAIIIPNKAVSIDNGQQQVTVMKNDKATEVINIKAGLTDGRNVAVLEGLKAGDVVVYETTSK